MNVYVYKYMYVSLCVCMFLLLLPTWNVSASDDFNLLIPLLCLFLFDLAFILSTTNEKKDNNNNNGWAYIWRRFLLLFTFILLFSFFLFNNWSLKW